MCIECANFVTQASVTSLYRTVMYVAVYNQRCIKLKAYTNIYTYIACYTHLQYFIHLFYANLFYTNYMYDYVFIHVSKTIVIYIHMCIFIYNYILKFF